MVSHSVGQVTWVEHVTKVYSYVVGKLVDFNFYSFKMNGNDVADVSTLASTTKLEVVVGIMDVGLGRYNGECVHDDEEVL